jgi:acyl-CoA synthetase (AMP-forming)/AMP-acid ligase II
MKGLIDRLRSARADLAAVQRALRAAPTLRPGANATIATLLAQRARQMPQRTGLVFENRRWTWQELDQDVNRWANLLGTRGVRAGEVVALVMDNRPEYLLAQTALVRLGAVPAFINAHLAGEALQHAVGVSGARALLAGREHRDKLEPLRGGLAGITDARWWYAGEGEDYAAPDLLDGALRGQSAAPPPSVSRKATDTGCYIYTSGTTGLPKAAIVTHRRWLGAAAGFAFVLADAHDDDVIYCTLPLYHSSAQFAGWGGALFTGATLLLRRRFSTREFWNDVHAHGATVFLYIGELCRYLLNAPPQARERGHRLRVAVGNGLRETIWAEFQQRFGIPLVREFYGSTEGNVALLNVEGRVGYVGRLRPGMAVIACDPDSAEPLRDAKGRCRRVATGETGLIIGLINPLLSFDGYLDRKATQKKILEGVFFARDRWFNTGDLVRVDAGGWVAFADRAGDNYRWKGENISAGEVEAALHGCPGVSEAIVYGVDVPGAEGRAGMAALVTTEGFDIETFARWVRERLPSYQQPRFVRLLGGDAKTTGTFKYQKAAYRAEGFDPARTTDALFLRVDGHYEPLDAAVLAGIVAGRRVVG